MTATAHESLKPLAATLARIAALDPTFQIRLIERLDGEWCAATEFVADSARLDESLRRVMAPYTDAPWPTMTRDRHIAAALLINSYAWFVPAAAIAAYLVERRAPDLDPANIALRLRAPDEGGVMEVGLLSGCMAVLPDDSAAAAPGVIVVPDPASLRDWLRRRLEAHLEPLIATIHQRTGFSRRAQWNLVADDCAALFLWVGQRAGDPERACAEGLAFVGAPDSPMRKSRTGYITLHYRDRCETFRKRGGCCLYYRLPTKQNCSACPLLAEEERDRRLLELMASHHA